MNKFLIRFLYFSLICFSLIGGEKLNALVPYYYLPSTKHLKEESLSIGKSAYQLLYFRQIKDSLNLAKLAVQINKSDSQLWSILAESQLANKLYKEALTSLKKAQEINPEISELYFAQSDIYLKLSKIKEAKVSLTSGLKLEPKNDRGIFQLGNIFLMEKNYESAIKEFDKAVEINPDFWQAINNKGLAYFELDKIDLSIVFFKKSISLEENAEPLLALAICLQNRNINEAILLAKKALIKDPNYVDNNYRKEQLWGRKLQIATDKLFKNPQLNKEIILAKTKINKTS